MGHEFDRTIAVSRSEDAFEAELDAGWVVGGGVNGGYLLAVLGNAIRETLPGKPDPFSLSAYYLSATAPGPARVTIEVLRDGGSIATARAELSQDGVARITALASYGDVRALPDDVRTTATPPEVPAVEACVPTSLAPEDVRR